VLRGCAGVFYGQPRGSEFSSFQLSPPFVIDGTLVSSPLTPDLIGRLFPKPQVRDPATGQKELIAQWIDLLRNETPLYGYINTDHPEWTNISTSTEPVGEQEG
jgi:hypothetical protein